MAPALGVRRARREQALPTARGDIPTVPFSPEEIESKEFLVVLRGYDKDEVGSFLRAVADDVRSLTEQVAQGADGAAAEPAPPAAAQAPVEQAAPASSGDVFTDLGSEMAAVLRSANEAAQTL